MTSLSEQLSAVRKSQWEAQLDVFRALSSRALDNAEQLIALNLKTSRASVEQAAGTFKQLLEANSPGDLLAAGSAAQGQWQQLFSYGRELLSIATGTQVFSWSNFGTATPVAPPAPVQLIPAPAANIPTSVPQVAEQVAIATADATTVTSEIAAAAADTGAALAQAALHAVTPAAAPAPEVTEPEAEKAGEPALKAGAEAVEAAPETAAEVEAAIETAIADETPPAKAKPLARALNKVAPKPASAEHPIASTLPLEAHEHVDLPIVTPVESTPPPHVPAQEAKPSRASRKK